MTEQSFRILHRVANNKPHHLDSHLITRDRAPHWLRKFSLSDHFTILSGASTIEDPGTSDFLVGAFKPGQFVVAELVGASELGNMQLFSGKSLGKSDWVLLAHQPSMTIHTIQGNITDLVVAQQARPNRWRNPHSHESVISFSWNDLYEFRKGVHRLSTGFANHELAQPEWWRDELPFLLSNFDKDAFVDRAIQLRGLPYLAEAQKR